jgi:hypothetical protein
MQNVFPFLTSSVKVSGEFGTFLLAFLGTVTLLAVSFRLGLLDRFPVLRALLPSVLGGGGTPSGGGGTPSGGGGTPSGGGGAGPILAAAARDQEAAQYVAVASLVAFFAYVGWTEALDEARFTVLGLCNPLLYGLPFALHFVMLPKRPPPAPGPGGGERKPPPSPSPFADAAQPPASDTST